MRRSITLRLTVFFAVVSTAVLLAIGYVVSSSVDGHFVELDRMELQTKLELARHVLRDAGSAREVDAIAARMDAALIGHHGIAIRVTGVDGATLYSTRAGSFAASWSGSGLRKGGGGAMGDDRAPGQAAELATWQDGGHRYRGIRTRAPLGTTGGAEATVEISMNIDHHHEFLVAFQRGLWAAIATAILLSGLLGWMAARRGLAPVREMARVAQNITATRLGERLTPETLPAELQDLALSFNGMLSRLEGSFRRLSDFSSDIAHELRTPICNLTTQTQVALSRPRSVDEYRDVLGSSVEELDRLSRMVADMLFLAKADNGLIVPRTESVDLAGEVRALFDFYDAMVEDRGVQLALAGEATVKAERLMIRRAISNLLANAISHTPRGGIVQVRIAHPESGEVRLTVENPGQEIAPEHLPRIFDRFYRIDPSRNRASEGEGAGLGLAITRSIVAAHRGVVRAFSGEGTTRFEIVLPAGAPG